MERNNFVKKLTFAKHTKKFKKQSSLLNRIEKGFSPRRVLYSRMIEDPLATPGQYWVTNPRIQVWESRLYASLENLLSEVFERDGYSNQRFECRPDGSTYPTKARRSIVSLYNVVHTYFPHITIRDLLVYLHKEYYNFYCHDAKKRVYCRGDYVPTRHPIYQKEAQDRQRDEYGLLRKDWKKYSQILNMSI